MEKEPQASSPIKAMPIRHIPPQSHLLSEQEMLSPQAPPPSWDSPPRPSTLKTRRNFFLTLKQPTWRRLAKPHHTKKRHLLATPEEEINPELIEFVKRDQFHDLFSEYALEHIDHFDNPL
ncbi:unnamed protein product [Microthlaspi erraticum]|uniref:Uncharacterized protein n=1 Tax=Microthlaspi erraticum TaxID=1685480 RepID=A0A6D2JZB2_9BRAS|nr:unnamed protein product [Microthlaspi erraticum]